jgi:predicted GNAT superfamily acetyltransferase
LYGQLDDSLNRGRLTDRFEVEWHVKSERVRERIEHCVVPGSLKERLFERAEPVNQTREIHSRLRVPSSARLNLREKILLVEIPSNIVRIRDASAKASNTWTLHARRIFENYFQKGYAVTDVALDNEESRVFYVLENRIRGPVRD